MNVRWVGVRCESTVISVHACTRGGMGVVLLVGCGRYKFHTLVLVPIRKKQTVQNRHWWIGVVYTKAYEIIMLKELCKITL